MVTQSQIEYNIRQYQFAMRELFKFVGFSKNISQVCPGISPIDFTINSTPELNKVAAHIRPTQSIVFFNHEDEPVSYDFLNKQYISLECEYHIPFTYLINERTDEITQKVIKLIWLSLFIKVTDILKSEKIIQLRKELNPDLVQEFDRIIKSYEDEAIRWEDEKIARAKPIFLERAYF